MFFFFLCVGSSRPPGPKKAFVSETPHTPITAAPAPAPETRNPKPGASRGTSTSQICNTCGKPTSVLWNFGRSSRRRSKTGSPNPEKNVHAASAKRGCWGGRATASIKRHGRHFARPRPLWEDSRGVAHRDPRGDHHSRTLGNRI